MAAILKKIFARVILTMFEPTAGRLQLDINSLLVNIYIYIYRQLCWERGNIHCVRPLGRMHTILVKTPLYTPVYILLNFYIK